MPFRKADALAATRLMLCLLAISVPAEADIVVIGNPEAGVESLDEQMISDLYLGRTVQIAGMRVKVTDLPIGHPARNEFYKNVLGKDPEQIRAYWAKRIFTGKGSPPGILPDEEAVVKWVSEAPGRIGYVRSEALDKSKVKVLFRKGPV
jgi:ABC-type phosphate transport system substrate-binding protein